MSRRRTAQQARFARAAKVCKRAGSRAARNRCMSAELRGRGYGSYGSPQGRRHRGWGGRRRRRRY